MLRVILYQPEIPPNTGNIIRLCANTGADLSLIRPLGFELDAKRLRRAGLDYHEFAQVDAYDSLDECLNELGRPRLWALTTKASRPHSDADFVADDALLFGPETRGLPPELLERTPPQRCLRVPMRSESRSLNLSNSVAVVVYEAWRQLGYPGCGE